MTTWNIFVFEGESRSIGILYIKLLLGGVRANCGQEPTFHWRKRGNCQQKMQTLAGLEILKSKFNLWASAKTQTSPVEAEAGSILIE